VTRALVFLGLLALGLLAWTVLAAEFAGDVKRAERWLARRLMPAGGTHAGHPGRPVHPRFGALADTPPDGIEAVRPDGTITVGAHDALSDAEIAALTPRREPIRGRQPWQPCEPPPDPSPSMLPLTGPLPKVMP
jgi:hypothetical protein